MRVEFFLVVLKVRSEGVGRILLGDNMEAEGSCCGQSGSFVIDWTGLPCVCIYRVIHKSLRDFRPLWYSSRDGHAEGAHVNRGRETPSFCPTLQVLDMLTCEGS